jgi:hypothetical protein
MQVKTGGRLYVDAPAAAEPTEDLLFRDYYSQTPRLRVTVEAEPGSATEIMLDHNDMMRLVECAIRHPSLNMRQSVLTAIWNHPGSFREIFRFGLGAPEAYAEIRKIVAEELAKHRSSEAGNAKPVDKTLLPKLPLPEHLRRGKK